MSFNNYSAEGQVFRLLAFFLVACLLCYPYMGILPVLSWAASSIFILWFFYQLNSN